MKGPVPKGDDAAQPGPQVTAGIGPQRRKYLLMFSVPLVVVIVGLGLWLSSGRYQTTDNAYLHQARIQIAADLSGRVVLADTAENEQVAKGDLLFRIDPEPFRIALSQADAAVASARVQVREMKAGYESALVQRERAQENLDFALTDNTRQTALADKGVVTTAALDTTRNALDNARQGLAAAEAGVQSAIAALDGHPDSAIDAHPLVRQALAARDRAAYNLGQTEVYAPADGVLAQASSFKTGQFVDAGAPLFTLVVTGDSWVDANLKETDLAGVAPGQSARVIFDAFPDRSLAATVEAITAGTGAEFALLPAQNATGNWVKVTQRVPVRLRFRDGEDLSGLRAGMTASVRIDTRRPTELQTLDHDAARVGAKVDQALSGGSE